jgi:hypothetical protein
VKLLATIRRFLFFAYGFSVGRLIYVCLFHFADRSLMPFQATWIVNVVLAFVLILVQSLERGKTE